MTTSIVMDKLNKARLQLVGVQDLHKIAKVLWDSSRDRAVLQHKGLDSFGNTRYFPSYSRRYMKKKAAALGVSRLKASMPDTKLSGKMWSYSSMGVKITTTNRLHEIIVYFKGSTSLAQRKAHPVKGILAASSKFASAAKAFMIVKRWGTYLLGVDHYSVKVIEALARASIDRQLGSLPLDPVKVA